MLQKRRMGVTLASKKFKHAGGQAMMIAKWSYLHESACREIEKTNAKKTTKTSTRCIRRR
jgi:hypothetical protein